MHPLKKYLKSIIVAELNTLARRFERVIQWRPRDEDVGFVLGNIDCKERVVARSITDMPGAEKEKTSPSLVLLNGNLNHDLNIEDTLSQLGQSLGRSSRVALVVYNSYLKFFYQLLNFFGLREGELPSTFITEHDLRNISRLSGYDVVRTRPMCYFPFRLFGLGDCLNALLPSLPFSHWFSLVSVFVLRPIVRSSELPSLTIVIPARNERGNIENAMKRLPYLDGAEIEVIYVEGHSRDNTWEEIQRVEKLYKDRYEIRSYQQTGKGKVDAVRLGFSHATKDLLVILDADLTMPPEKLESFYSAYREGYADFINGSRLVYPMEGQAMRFLNKIGNVFFAKALSFVMGTRIGDSLCGTKLVSREDYARFVQWRNEFGDFDPFGDYELLFPAAELALGIVDIPVHYRDRTYGSTNIRRFRDGLILLKMTCFGLFKMKFGKIPPREFEYQSGMDMQSLQSSSSNACS